MSTERTGEWEPLNPKLVVEVQYDHSRRALPPRHEIPALASRQAAQNLLDGSSHQRRREARSAGVASDEAEAEEEESPADFTGVLSMTVRRFSGRCA
jgi:hypothetical protein